VIFPFKNSMNTVLATIGTFVSITAMVLAPTVAAAPTEDLLHPGMWEIVSTVQIPNNPQMHGQDRHTHCYTSEDVAGINAKSAALMTTTVTAPDAEQCTVKDLKYVGNKGTWNVTCPNSETVHAELVFHGDSFDGFITTGTGDDAIKATMAAKRTGACE
jgi:hypothetical protein